MADVGVRLGGDNSEFIAMMRGSVAAAGQFSGQIAGEVTESFTKTRKIGNALAAALNLDMQSVAEGLARLITGMSKEEEQAYKDLGKYSDELTTTQAANLRKQRTDEQNYQADLAARAKLQKQLEEMTITGAKSSTEATRLQVEIEKKSGDIIDYEIKQRAELTKKVEEQSKRRAELGEKEFQLELGTLSAAEKIATLKDSIVFLQNAIASGVLSQKNAEELTAVVAARGLQVKQEEARLQKEAADNAKKFADAENDAMVRRDDELRKLVPLEQQRLEILDEIKVQELVIQEIREQGLDATQALARMETLRGQLKDVEKKQSSDNVELAKLLLKGEANLTEEEKLKLSVLRGQTTEKKIQDEIGELLARGVDNLTGEEKARLAVLVGQSEEYQRQIAKLNEIQAITISIKRSGQSYEQQSTAALEGVAARVKKQLDDIHQLNAIRTASQRDPTEVALASEYQQIINELHLRATVGSYVTRFDENAARREFGDTITNRALQDMQTATARTATAVTTLQQQLQDFLKMPAVPVPQG